ncbi:MAG: rep protein [Neisseria sp.]|nr:MAG: rep protein [Neisseria sp.]
MMTEKLQPRKTKRPMTAREMAEKFNVAESTITRWWSQSRADYLAENTISRDKPWEKLGISRATWYRRGKPMPSENQEQA